MVARPGSPASPDPARPPRAGLDPLFAGETDIDQLGRIIARLGSPDGAAWPGAAALPDYGKLRFAPAPPRPLAEALPDAPAAAVDLLGRLLRWDPGAELELTLNPELTLSPGPSWRRLLLVGSLARGAGWPHVAGPLGAKVCRLALEQTPLRAHAVERRAPLLRAPARPLLSAGGARHRARACSSPAKGLPTGGCG